MWKANGKTTTLLLFLDSLFQKQRHARCFLWRQIIFIEECDLHKQIIMWLEVTRKEKILEIERGSTRSLSMENSLWKRLWTCRKTTE
jgi:hypothetical protein